MHFWPDLRPQTRYGVTTAERRQDMHEVVTLHKSSVFDTLEEAEEAYFEACNYYEFVLMQRHGSDGCVEEIWHSW